MITEKNRFLILLVAFFGVIMFATIYYASKVIISEYETEMYNTFAIIKEDGIKHRKNIAQDRVQSVMQYLDAEQKMVEYAIKEKIKNSVETAYSLLFAYYERNKEQMSLEDMKKNMLEFLRQMRWDNGRGYYFIINTQGVEILSPLNKELEGIQVSSVVDAEGKRLFKEMLDIAKNDGSGYIEYLWSKQELPKESHERKISYLKKFEPFDWIIVTGEYPEDYSAEVKKKVVQKLSYIRFLNVENDYLFIYQFHDTDDGVGYGEVIANPNRPEVIGTKLVDIIRDVNGKVYRPETFKKSKEGFVEYYWKVSHSDVEEQKISYYAHYPKWDWLVASGVYLGDIEKEYDASISALSKKVEEKISNFRMLFILLGLSLLLFAFIVLNMQKKRMEKASKEIEHLNSILQDRVEEEVKKRVALEDEKNMREKLFIQLVKMAEMGEMIGVITHQWKQPLNNISLLTQDITQMQKFGELNDETISSTTEAITGQLGFMLQTIDDFRDFFKPDKERHTFSAKHAVSNVLKIFSIQIKVYNIEVLFDSEAIQDRVFGVENEFKQVVLNILNNSKDMFLSREQKESRVSIFMLNDGDNIVIEMVDTAGGIDSSLLPDKIFESYVSTKGDKGTGIGLSMSKMIIEQRLGGTICASNSDNGAKFKIILPTSKTEELE